MKYLLRLLVVILIFSVASCGGKEESKEKEKIKIGNNQQSKSKADPVKTVATAEIDLTNKGVGPIKSLELDAEIDQTMVLAGQEVFKSKCSACHKPAKKFIGPAPTGITERRSPEWIMNMILDPEGMVKNDPIAKQLLIEYNGSPMANQNLTEEEARSILEYFRTLKAE